MIRKIADARRPASESADELEKLHEVPSVGLYASFRLAALFE